MALATLILLAALAGRTAARPAAAAQVTVSPTNPSGSAVEFTVTWSGVDAPEDHDWLSMFCVGADVYDNGNWSYLSARDAGASESADGMLSGAGWLQRAQRRWVAAAACSAALAMNFPALISLRIVPGWKSGSGSMTLTVPFTTCPLEFRALRDIQVGGPYALLAASAPISWTGGDSTPRHVRVAYGRQPQTELSVSWTSEDNISPAVLQLGTRPGVYDLPNITAAAPLTYLNSDLCATSSSWSHPGYFHHALATGLKAGTRYYARPTQAGAAGAETSFETGKPRGGFVPTRFAFISDMAMSGGNGGVKTVERVEARIPELDFLIHIGDISYGCGSTSTWETWFNTAQRLTSRLPYHVSIGNHEYDYPKSADGSKDPSGAGEMFSPAWWNGGSDGGGECGVPTARRFRTPANGQGVFWYSFEERLLRLMAHALTPCWTQVGNVHIVMVSSEHDPSPGTPMGDWMEEDLMSVDRDATPWLIVGIHRPIVNSQQYASDYRVAQELYKIMEPLLLKARVDAVLSGHYHAFQRSCLVAAGECVADGGILHYTNGAAGHSLETAGDYDSKVRVKSIVGDYAYTIVDAPNATALGLTLYLNKDDSVADEVWLYK